MIKRECLVICALLFSIFLIMPAVHASEMREIELTDGTVIAGEIVSLSDNVYTVRSASLGTVQIEGSRIRTIRAKGSVGNPGAFVDQVQSLQEKMAGSGEIMSIIKTLESDPEFQEILHDPDIMRAVQAGDISALMANAKFMKLLNKQEVQQIKKEIGQ
jgi:hypothetical protein